MTKICSKCGKRKSLDQYHANKAGKHGKSSFCKVCKNKQNRPHNLKKMQQKQDPENKRRCISCNKQKKNKEFLFKGRICQPCRKFEFAESNDMSEYRRNYHYRKNLKEKQFIFNYLSKKSCVVCQTTDVMVLEFDHIQPSKKSFEISRALMNSKTTIAQLKKEIAKCQVLCSNCHKRKTLKENKSWRYLMKQGFLPAK